MTREEAIKRLSDQLNTWEVYDPDNQDLREAIEMAIEALQEPERKKGKWIKAYPTNTEVWMCSECHYIDEPKWSYCRNCGAEMGEEQ